MNDIRRKVCWLNGIVRRTWIGSIITLALPWLAVPPLQAQSPADQLLSDQTPPLVPNQVDSLHRLLRPGKTDANQVNLLLELGTYYLCKAQEMGTDPDSADHYARQAYWLSKRLAYREGLAGIGMLLGRIYLERGDHWHADSCFNGALALLREIGNTPREAQTWLRVGKFYPRRDEDIAKKIQCYQRALFLYRQTGSKVGEAVALREIADMHQLQGKQSQALQELLQAVRLQQSVGDRYIYQSYALLGYVHRIMGNHQVALQYHLASLKSAQACGDTNDLSPFYYRMGKVYRDAGQLSKALEYYQKSLSIRERIKAPTIEILKATREMLIVLLKDKQLQQAQTLLKRILNQYPPRTGAEKVQAALCLGDSYMAVQAYALAEKHYLVLLQLPKPDPTIQLDSHLRLGKVYQAKGQYAEARYYLEKALLMNAQRSNLVLSRDLHLQLFKLDSAQARLTSAIRHYQQYKAISDSLFNEIRSNQMLSVQAQYEVEKKNHYIDLLTQRSKVQHALIGQRQTERNAWIGGAVLLLLLVGVIYNRYRLKQKSNQFLEAQQRQLQAQHEALQVHQLQLQAKQQLLEAKQEEVVDKNQLLEGLVEQREWLLKEVHHRVKNNLQIIISLLQSQAHYLSDEAAIEAIHQSEHRVWTMALIHQKLYRSDTLFSIYMPAYLQEVVEQLAESFDATNRIGFDFQLEPLDLDVVQAVPLGLIVNEAVTNALKYAFPRGRAGFVRFSLRQVDPQRYELVIADDGVGLPSALDLERSRSMGAKIMFGLSQQLEGQLKVESQGGVKITVTFQVSQVQLPAGLTQTGPLNPAGAGNAANPASKVVHAS